MANWGSSTCWGTGLLVIAAASMARADVVLETRDMRLALTAEGACRSVLAKATQTEYAWQGEIGPAFAVVRGNKIWPATAVSLQDDRLMVQFGQAQSAVELRIVRTDNYLAFKLGAIEGQPVDAIHLLQLRLKPLPNLGPWIDVAYDDCFGICLCGGNSRTNAGMVPPSGDRKYLEMRATAHKEPGFRDTAAILFGCPEPRARFLDAMGIVERDFQMPRGAKHRQSKVQKYSYLWPSPSPKDIEEYVRWAKRGGFRMILFSYAAFSKGVGHFEWNSNYPNGIADLKTVADAVRKAGLAVGMHIHYNKAFKRDPYVTPVPDGRLHTVRRFTLASGLEAKSDVIRVNEDPKGSTLDNDRRILKIGKELVAYTQFTTARPYQFTGCQRGAFKTVVAAHAAGQEVALLNVDEWPIFIRFDQNTDIQDEVARRIADLVNQTGPYDMIYFDGAEDVHEPFWYHCANAQWRVYRLFKQEPAVCEAAANTHFGWHMISRSNAYDSVAPEEMKDFCRKNPARFAPVRARDFTRIEFGWLHGFSRNAQSYITPDTLEYVLSRGAAWDCPFSMTVSLKQLKDNPRTESCFDAIKTWEDARIEGELTDAQRKQLENLDQEHHLFVNEEGQYELVPIKEVGSVAGGKSVRAWTFTRPRHAKHTYVLMWATRNMTDLTLSVPASDVRAMRPFGKSFELKDNGGKTTVTVSERTYLVLSDKTVVQAEQILRGAS